MAHRATKTMLRLRREKVHVLRSQEYSADEIYNGLKEQFPHITLANIYSDIKYLKNYAKAYVILEYIDDFSDELAKVKALANWALGEAVNTYHNGREEIHNIQLPDGRKMVKHVRKFKDLKALELIVKIGLIKVKLLDNGPVIERIISIEQENRQLKGVMTTMPNRKYMGTLSPQPLQKSCQHVFSDRGNCLRCGLYSKEYDSNAVF